MANNPAMGKILEGERLIEEGDNEGAVTALTEAIRFNPRQTRSYHSRAEALRRLGRQSEAAADMSHAAELSGQRNTASTRYQLQIGDSEEAVTKHYVISFLLAGLIGLLVQYLTRDKGWRGVKINAVIFVILVILTILAEA